MRKHYLIWKRNRDQLLGMQLWKHYTFLKMTLNLDWGLRNPLSSFPIGLGVGELEKQVLYVDIHDLKIWVNDVYFEGNLNLNSLYTNIPFVFCDRLKALPICLNSLVPDRLTWKGHLDGIYTASDCYKWLNILEFVQNTTENNFWKWVWHIPTLKKVKCIIWTTLHKSFPTRLMLCHHGMLEMNLCPSCN